MHRTQLTPQPAPSGPVRERGQSRAAVRGHAPLAAVGGVVLVLVLLACAAAPPQARALSVAGIDLNPIHWPGDLLGGLVGDIAGLAVRGFDAIIRALFAPVAKFITTQLIGWLIAVPNLTQGNVASLEQTVEAMAGGTLGAVATISVIRYWAAGFAGGGDSGFSALEGLTRTVAAALFLAVWPWLFDSGVRLTNLFTSSLMRSGAVIHSVSHLLAAGLGAGVALQFTPVGLFLNIAMAVAASLLFLGLLLVKIVLSISTILIFVAMPLAAVLWPVVPWVARLAARAFAVCLMVPVIWALCFAASAAVSLNALTFNAGSVMNALLEPLVAIVLLWVMLRLPMALARLAMLGSMSLGGGIASRAVSYAAGTQLRDTAKAHLPGWAGGQNTPPSARGQQAETQTGSRLRSAATLAGATATGGTTAAATAGGTGASAGAASVGASGSAGASGAGATAGAASGRSYTPPPTAQANTSGQSLQNGLQTPSFAGREQDFQNETFEAQHRARTSPVSGEQARAALASLPESTQRAVGQLVAEHGAGAREHLAYQAMGEWSAQEREALRTLAAASPRVRAQALDATLPSAAHGTGTAAGAAPDITANAPLTAPAQGEVATQSGWSHIDTPTGAQPPQTPSGPPGAQTAAPDTGGASHQPGRESQPPGDSPAALGANGAIQAGSRRDHAPGHPPASNGQPAADQPPARRPAPAEPQDPTGHDPSSDR